MPVHVARLVCSATELLAVEHRGQLLSVPELESRFEVETSPARFTDAGSFARRVLSLGSAGLRELAEMLDGAHIPDSARLDPDGCCFLPPAHDDRALVLVQRQTTAGCRLQWGLTRCLRGHMAPLRIPGDERHAWLSVTAAAVLGEDLAEASVEQAAHAIAGLAVLTLWSFADRDRQLPGSGSVALAQLGPCLILDSKVDGSRPLVQLAIDGQAAASGQLDLESMSLADRVAMASRGCELRAGDVIAAEGLCGLTRAWRSGETVSAMVEGLGELQGVVVR